MNSNLAISKLIILKIVKQIPAITSNQLTNLALETLYMDYFTFMQAFSELKRDHMLQTATRKNENETDAAGRAMERCDITRQGETVLKTLDHKIPLHVKSYLLQSTSSRKKALRKRHDIRADYEPDANGHYVVSLSQHDGVHDLIDIRLTLPDKQLAQRVCNHWKSQPGSTYVTLLALLTGESDRSHLNDSLKHPDSDDASHDENIENKPYKTQQRLF